jgi:FixJ family two-component response regulator
MPIQGKAKVVAIVHDDDVMRTALQGLLKSAGLPTQAFASAEEFLGSGHRHDAACLITDICMPGVGQLGDLSVELTHLSMIAQGLASR